MDGCLDSYFSMPDISDRCEMAQDQNVSGACECLVL